MLYQRLKRRNVLVVPGEHFFFGTPENAHSRECLRVSYAMDPEIVRAGLEIIAEEVEAVWAEAT
jgi:valine--pyruvate aminotransferase